MTALLARPESGMDVHEQDCVRLGTCTMSLRRWAPLTPGAPTVVLIHGLNTSGDFHLPTAKRLAGRFEVIVPDLPGFGRSDAPGALSVAELGGALCHWLDRHGRPVSLVGTSFGCQVATEVAMRRPDAVERLVLAAPTIDPSARTVPRQLLGFRRETKLQSRELQRVLLGDYRAAGARRAWRTFRAAVEDRIEDRLPFIDAPTLVVWGTADPLVSRGWAETVAALLPQGELAVLEGGPHAVSFDAADEFVAAIADFLGTASHH